MYDVIAADALTSAELWACFTALRALDDALVEIVAATDEAQRLAAESAWEAKGLGPSSLRLALERHPERMPIDADRVRTARSSVEGLVA